MDIIDTNRYIIEPRCDRACHHWLIVFDKVANDYIKEGTTKAYARFEDSDEILKALGTDKRLVEEEPKKKSEPVDVVDIPFDHRTMSFYLEKALKKRMKVIWVTTVMDTGSTGQKLTSINKIAVEVKKGHYKTYYVKFFNSSMSDPVMHSYMYLDRITFIDSEKYGYIVCQESDIKGKWETAKKSDATLTNKKFINDLAISIVDRFCSAVES